MSERYTLGQLAGKIEWEGGVFEALEYGIKANDVPVELEKLWAEAVSIHRDLADVIDEIAEHLNDVEPEDLDE